VKNDVFSAACLLAGAILCLAGDVRFGMGCGCILLAFLMRFWRSISAFFKKHATTEIK
jgi:hypothetical protein